MTTKVLKPPADRPSGFTVPYRCSRCGGQRAVLARNVNPRLGLARRWRDAGPCRDCGHPARWWIEDRDEAWLIHVDRG